MRAINARGDIVGRFLDASRIPHGYLLSDGIYTTIDFPGAARTTATGINARGNIVGDYTAASIRHGFVATRRD